MESIILIIANIILLVFGYIAVGVAGSLLLMSRGSLTFKKIYAFMIRGKVIELTDYHGDKYYTIMRPNSDVYWSDGRFLMLDKIFGLESLTVNKLDLINSGQVKDSWLKTWKQL